MNNSKAATNSAGSGSVGRFLAAAAMRLAIVLHFLRYLRLTPYDNRLRSASAALWQKLVRIPLLAISLADAIAWSNLAFNSAQGEGRWIAAGFIFVVVFLVISSIDVSLITYDRAAQEHARSILREESPAKTWWPAAAFGFRLLILTGTLYVTAPFLTMVVLHRDIDHFIAVKRHDVIESRRNAVIAKYDSALARKDAEIQAKRRDLESECAGKGQSGKYGCGPVAKAIGENLTKLENERAGLVNREKEDLAGVSGGSDDASLPQASILENWHALKTFATSPEYRDDYRATEFSVQAFLVFIYMSLLVLKAFEPRDCRGYYSAILQNAYLRYVDKMPDATVQDFHRFLTDPDEGARRDLEALGARRVQCEQELIEARLHHDELLSAQEDAKRGLNDHAVALSEATGKRDTYRAKLRELECDSPHYNLESRHKLISHFQRETDGLEGTLKALGSAHHSIEAKSQRADLRLAAADAAVREKQSELDQIDKHISGVKLHVLNSIVRHAVSVLQAPKLAKLAEKAVAFSPPLWGLWTGYRAFKPLVLALVVLVLLACVVIAHAFAGGPA